MIVTAGYSCLFVLFCLTFGSALLHLGKEINRHSDQDTEFVSQLVEDWNQGSYTDIQVFSGYCAPGYEPMFESYYQGTAGGCDCTGICGYYMNGCWKLHIGTSCTYN